MIQRLTMLRSNCWLAPAALLFLTLGLSVPSLSCAGLGAGVSTDGPQSGPSVELLKQGDQLFQQEKYLEAKQMYARAVSAEGPNHAYVEACAQVARMESLTGNQAEGQPWLSLAARRARKDDPLGWSRLQIVIGIYEREAGAKPAAVQRFMTLYEYCLDNELYERAIDAAHHVVLASDDFEQQMTWSQRGIEAAEAGGMNSWLAVVWNNKGAALEQQGRWEDALTAYLSARDYHREGGDPQRILIANWAVARAQRMTGRLLQAKELSMLNLGVAQQRYVDDPTPDNAEWVGYCTWEMAELADLDGFQQPALVGLRDARAHLIEAGIENWGEFGTSELARLDARIAELAGAASE